MSVCSSASRCATAVVSASKPFIRRDRQLERHRIRFVVREARGVVGERGARELVAGKLLRHRQPRSTRFRRSDSASAQRCHAPRLRRIDLLRPSRELANDVGPRPVSQYAFASTTIACASSGERGDDAFVERNDDFRHLAVRLRRRS